MILRPNSINKGVNMNGFEYCRLRAGLTQVEAASELNVSQSTISTWENGTNFPTGNKIPAIARLYDCEIGELYEGSEEKTRLNGMSRREYEMRMFEARKRRQ